MAKTVTNLPAMRETQVRCLGLEDRLEKKMTPDSSTLGYRSRKESDVTD